MSSAHAAAGPRRPRRLSVDLWCRPGDDDSDHGDDGERSPPAETPPPFAADPLVITLAEWEAPDADLLEMDARVAERAERGWCVVRFTRGAHDSGRLARAWRQAAIRYQRFRARRNGASETPWFGALLRRHRALHDVRKPLVAADYAHALDVWQWALRLDPAASFDLQAAALLHDIERLVSESDTRVEQHAADYAAFKERHARAGALIAAELLRSIGASRVSVARVQALIAGHEHAPELSSADAPQETDKQLLADADALSFFSLNAHGFVRYYGAAHTDRKVAHSLARLSVRARGHLPLLKLPPIVSAQLARHLALEARADSP